MAKTPMKKLDDVFAYQLAIEFKKRLNKLIDEHPRAKRDFAYVDQLLNAASSIDCNMAEGWARFAAGELRQFLRYALGSLEEAKRRVVDGIGRGYFTEAECHELLTIGNRCGAATMGWWRSLEPFVRRPKPVVPPSSRPRPAAPKR